jgi:hypothetical protein
MLRCKGRANALPSGCCLVQSLKLCCVCLSVPVAYWHADASVCACKKGMPCSKQQHLRPRLQMQPTDLLLVSSGRCIAGLVQLMFASPSGKESALRFLLCERGVFCTTVLACFAGFEESDRSMTGKAARSYAPAGARA